MERLQQALNKARTARAGNAPAATPRKGQARQASAPDVASAQSNAEWAALKPIPYDPATLVRNRVVVLEAGHEATQFDILRTKIMLQMQRNGWKRLAITSPTASCGKTTTALNITLGLTRQPGLRATLLEMDLRRPNIANVLGMRPEIDITEVLTGAVDISEQAMRVGDNVAISMARRPAKDPTRYMHSQETTQALEAIEARLSPDIMIFDLPPLLVNGDTRAFLGNVDCALLVVRTGQTSIDQIDGCEREIAEQTNMLGVVLNQCRFADDVSGYETEYTN